VKCQPYNQDKDDRSSDEIKAKFDSLFEILEITDDPPVPKEDVEKLKNEDHGRGDPHKGGGAVQVESS
jgi:hypothetical protein